MATRAEPRFRFAAAAPLVDALAERRFPNQPIVAAARAVAVEPETAIPAGPARALLDDVLVLARAEADRAATPALGARAIAQLAPRTARRRRPGRRRRHPQAVGRGSRPGPAGSTGLLGATHRH